MNSRATMLLARLSNLADQFCLWKMDRLTQIARKHLPRGYWGEPYNPHSGPGEICLTFDDGPCPKTTPGLLRVLAEAGVKATFFLIGANAARHPDLVERIAKEGHLIGNHSFNHHLLPALPAARLEREIDSTNEQIAQITGSAPVIFRPPYGILDGRVADCLRERGMLAVYWGAVPYDWERPGAARVVARVLARLSAGSLVVMHERGWLATQTISAAKEIICKGGELGHRFVGIPQLMARELS